MALRDEGVQAGVFALSLKSIREFNFRSSRRPQIDESDDLDVATLRVRNWNLTPKLPKLTRLQSKSTVLSAFTTYSDKHGIPDIVHLHSSIYAGTTALTLHQAYGIPYVYSEHSSALNQSRVRFMLRDFVRDVAETSSAGFAVSSSLARNMEASLKLPHKFMSVMPNSVHNSFFTHEIGASSGSEFRLVHASTLDKNKNVESLLRSFSMAFRGNLSVRLEIAGPKGPSFESLQRLVADLRLQDQVKFVGYLSRDQVPSFIATADAMVVSSRRETFGVAAAEALALGVPVVATKCGGPEDFIGPEDGLLVPVDDDEALAAALQAVIEPEMQKTRQDRRQRCRERFASEVLAKKWTSIYQKHMR